MPDPKPKHARVDPQNPQAWGQCDRCGLWYNARELAFQYEWSGMRLYNTGTLVCPTCIDIPQEQFRTIILPPDPPPIFNARVPNFAYEEQTVRITSRAGALYYQQRPNADPPWGHG